MPIGAMHVCPERSCGALVPKGQGRCAAHARASWRDRPPRQARGYTTDYDRARRAVLAEEECCGICGGQGMADDEVDHVIPLARGGGNERANLRRAHKRCNALARSAR